MHDYDRTLFYIQNLSFDELTSLMVETSDDFLSIKIKHFLDSLYQDIELSILKNAQYDLLSYLEHAFIVTPETKFSFDVI